MFAHPDIAFEFGMWISPKFKIYREKIHHGGRVLLLEWFMPLIASFSSWSSEQP